MKGIKQWIGIVIILFKNFKGTEIFRWGILGCQTTPPSIVYTLPWGGPFTYVLTTMLQFYLDLYIWRASYTFRSLGETRPSLSCLRVHFKIMGDDKTYVPDPMKRKRYLINLEPRSHSVWRWEVPPGRGRSGFEITFLLEVINGHWTI